MPSSRLAALASQSRSLPRCDGHTNNDPIFAFQAWAEARSDCDYDALRTVLYESRNLSWSLHQLKARYLQVS